MTEDSGQSTPAAAGAQLRDLIVVGASAGGVQALSELVQRLPADLPAAMLVVLHTAPSGRSALAKILRRVAALEVVTAEDMMPVSHGNVYVAQPNCHLLLRDGEVRLGRGPRENGHRPAVDPLFRSAARWYAHRALAVVLSGTLDDGAAGAYTIAQRGGAVVVQDPADAMYGGMPAAARQAVRSALVAPLAELPSVVARLVHGPLPAPAGPAGEDLVLETDMAELSGPALHRPERPGAPSTVTCPDCHGVLYQIDDQPLPRFRCRVGHAWSSGSLEPVKDTEVEDAMWIAVRNLEERASLYRELAERARNGGRTLTAGMYVSKLGQAQRAAETIRGLLTSGELGLSDQPSEVS